MEPTIDTLGKTSSKIATGGNVKSHCIFVAVTVSTGITETLSEEINYLILRPSPSLCEFTRFFLHCLIRISHGVGVSFLNVKNKKNRQMLTKAFL